MPVAYKKLVGPNSRSNNVGGTSQKWLLAPVDYFTTIATVKDLSDAGATDAKEFVEISDDHAFAASKGFLAHYCTRDMGSIKLTAVGERDGRGTKAEAELMIPGADADLFASMVMGKNDRWIVLAPTADGKYLQLGSEQFPAEIKYDWDAAKNESGLRGMKLTISAFMPQPQLYTGAIVEIA
jgi:hypothetical protein